MHQIFRRIFTVLSVFAAIGSLPAAVAQPASAAPASAAPRAAPQGATDNAVKAELKQFLVVNVNGKEELKEAGAVKPGDLLEYRITYTNTTAAPMTQVVIQDAMPAYTTFQSATAGTTPTALGNCTKNTPQNATPAAAVACATAQAAGGTGAIRWVFDGALNSTATGEVSFRVVVD